MFAAHVLMAAVLTLGGTVQLVPQLRRHALLLHRWNGRMFMVTALLMAMGGLGLNILRGNWGQVARELGSGRVTCIGP